MYVRFARGFARLTDVRSWDIAAILLLWAAHTRCAPACRADVGRGSGFKLSDVSS